MTEQRFIGLPCDGKMRHESKRTAAKYLRRYVAVNKPGGREAYRCAYCGFWHITSRTGAEARARYREMHRRERGEAA